MTPIVPAFGGLLRFARISAAAAAPHCLSRVSDCAGIVVLLTWPTICVGDESAPENFTVRSPRLMVKVIDEVDDVPVSDTMST